MSQITAKTVVVPWDFSETSKDALQKAISMVRSIEQIRVVYVSQVLNAADPSVMFGEYNEKEVAHHVHEHFLEVVSGDQKEIRFKTLFGDPGTEIGRFAEREGAGLIVIGSHGRTGFSRFFLGSVAERVVRLAQCPVLVLKPDEVAKGAA